MAEAKAEYLREQVETADPTVQFTLYTHVPLVLWLGRVDDQDRSFTMYQVQRGPEGIHREQSWLALVGGTISAPINPTAKVDGDDPTVFDGADFALLSGSAALGTAVASVALQHFDTGASVPQAPDFVQDMYSGRPDVGARAAPRLTPPDPNFLLRPQIVRVGRVG